MMKMKLKMWKTASAAGWIEYQRDVWERTVLFWDALRQRADNMLAHERAGLPPLLERERFLEFERWWGGYYSQSTFG